MLLAALAGGLAAVAARELVLGASRLPGWIAEAFEPLRRAGREGYEPSARERRRLAVLGTAALLAAGLYVAGPWPAPALAATGPAAAAWAVARRRRLYRRAVERGLPELATALSDALTGGRSLRAALAAVPASLEGPPAVEMARVRAELELGAGTGGAVSGFARRLRSVRVDGFCAALLSQQLGGGDLASLLRRYAAAAAERERVSAEARSATAQARFTGLLVVAMPAGAALFAELLDPGFLGRLLGEPGAGALLALAGILQLLGFAAIRRLSRISE